MALSPGTRLGRYVVESLLGAGGMGEVYLAEDRTLARRVAIKVLQGDQQDDGLLRRFEQEALAASALNHPHILTIYEFGTENGVRFLACEHVAGTSLRERLRQALPLPEAVNIGLQAATALDAAHKAGIVHRDVKPENLMIRPDGYVKVLDFGLAKRTASVGPLADAHTVLTSVPGMILGTVVYMSPEQARGMPVDTRADVWSLGCVLYEMVTGRAPFDGASPLDVLAAVLEKQPPDIAAARRDCPPALAALIDRMLLKDRDARIQSMSVVVEELRAIARALDAPLQPTDGPGRAAGAAADRTPVQRKLPVVLAAIAVVVGLAGALLVWSRSNVPSVVRDGAPAPSAESARTGSPSADRPHPVRTMEAWLTVQPMRNRVPDGDMFVSAGGRVFGNGWRFRLTVSSPDGGYLYVLNEGPDEGGLTTLVILRSGALNPGAMELPWYTFTEHAGTEQLWLVSSPGPLPELEALAPLINPRDRGLVSDPARVETLKRTLIRHQVSARDATADVDRQRIVVRSSAGTFAHLLKLEHH